MPEQHQNETKQDQVPENMTAPEVEDDEEDLNIFDDVEPKSETAAPESESTQDDEDEGEQDQEESDQNADSEDDTQDEDADQGEDENEAKPDSKVEELAAKLKAKQDEFAATNGELIDLTKATAQLVKSLEDDGVDRERIAQLAGITSKQVDGILNGERVKVHTAENPVYAKAEMFDAEYTKMKTTLDTFAGEDTQPLVAIFTQAMQHDKNLADDFLNYQGDIVSYVIQEGKKLRETIGDISQEGLLGTVKARNAEIVELKATIAEYETQATQDDADGDAKAETPKKPEPKGRPTMRGSSTGKAKPIADEIDLSDVLGGR